MLKHFLNPPNWFTSASLFCGMYAIVLATGIEGEPNFYRAAVMILFAGVFDMLDGRVARITKTASEFGIQLDSLADMVSFGLAPAVLVYAWGINSLGVWGLIGAFCFALCGAFRLARFNVGATLGASETSEGLTITVAGATLAASVMAHSAAGLAEVAHPWNVWLITLSLAWLMVSRVPYRTFKKRGSTRAMIIGLALFLGVVLVLTVRYRFPTAFIAVLGSYVVAGPLEAIIFFRRRRALRLEDHRVPMDEDALDELMDDDDLD